MRLPVLIAGIVVALAIPAAAQDMPTVLPQDYVLSDILNRQRIEASIGTPIDRPARKPVRRLATTPSVPTVAAVTHYRSSPAVSARVRRQFVTWMEGKVGAADARQVAGAIARNDPVANWAQLVAADGLRPNDLVDALASYWILNWAMANAADHSRSQVLAVRAQVRSILAANPAQARSTEAQRQETSETLILNFLIQHAAYDSAIRRGDRDAMRRLGEAAVARFRAELGLDLRRLQLTDRGFVPIG